MLKYIEMECDRKFVLCCLPGSLSQFWTMEGDSPVSGSYNMGKVKWLGEINSSWNKMW